MKIPPGLYGVVSVRGDLKEFSEFDRIWVWFFMEAYLRMVIFTEKRASKTIKLGYPKVDLEICKPTKNIRKNKETHTLYLT
jgi:hypothetical protein